MKKIIAILLIAAVMCLGGCIGASDAVLSEMKMFEVASEIHTLDVEINAADFKIEIGEKFSVESNLKYLSVSERNGVLIVEDKAKNNSNYANAKLTVCIPSGAEFDSIDIRAGAGKLTAGTLSAKSVELEFGAGDVRIESLTATAEADIEGGAGEITVLGGTLNNLSLEVGVGALNLTATLLGNCELNFGVGESNVTVLGAREDYRIEIEKGIGSITVDGKSATDFGSSGNGSNRIEIDGGVGAINLKFQEK